MPTYDYECSKCGHTFEKFQSIKDPAVRKCPSCGRNSVKRLIGTGAGIIFKGSGFYITDYRSDSYKKAAKAEKEGAAPAAKTGEGTNGTGKSGDGKKPAAAGKSAAGGSKASAST